MLGVEDDGEDVECESAGRPAVEQVVEAIAALQNRNSEAGLGGAVAEPRVHGEARDDWRECGLHSGQPLREARSRAAELDAHEEAPRIEVGILLAVENEAVAFREQTGDCGDDADRIDTTDRKSVV